MLRSILLFLACLILEPSYSQNSADPKIVLLRPTGDTSDSLIVMEYYPDTSALYRKTVHSIQHSFLKDAGELFDLLQNFLVNTGRQESKDPLYIALTNHDGGFARKGFVLVNNTDSLKKPGTFYIDILDSRFEGNVAGLMSVTQLVPHEMGHAIYRLLSSRDSLEQVSYNVNVHFFSVITDYSIAFNEGFGESMENVARLFEPNDTIKSGISQDLIRIASASAPYISAFKRDFEWPFRVGFYKASMIAWYQQYENFKRHQYAMDTTALFNNAGIKVSNKHDMITYRNSGVMRSDEKRNLVQALSTEGVISSFFTAMARSDLMKLWQSPEFYLRFTTDSVVSGNPENQFTSLQNLFMKYFHVMANHVILEQSAGSQLTDFVNGYINEFPAEREMVLEIFKATTGYEFPSTLPPQLWLMVKGFQHRILTTDPFGGLTYPVYNFDLNAAGIEDLLAIPGINREAAQAVLDAREDQGFFTDLSDVTRIEGLSENSKTALLRAEFDQEYFSSLDDGSLDISAIISTTLKNLFLNGILFFILITAFRYYLTIKDRPWGWSKISPVLRDFFSWNLLIIIGLVLTVIPGNSLKIIVPLIIVVIIAGAVIIRENPERQRVHVIMTLVMGFLLIYSLV